MFNENPAVLFQFRTRREILHPSMVQREFSDRFWILGISFKIVALFSSHQTQNPIRAVNSSRKMTEGTFIECLWMSKRLEIVVMQL